MCRKGIERCLNILEPETRRRLWTDHASEIGRMAYGIRDKQPASLPDHDLKLSVAMAIENGLELYVEQDASDRIKSLADEYQELLQEAKAQFSGDRWREAFCNLNADRGVARGPLWNTYDCSAEDWVDTCERFWKEGLEEVLSYVDREYLHSLTAELCSPDMTTEEQAHQLANVFRAMVAGGDVRLVDHEVAIQWGEINIDRARNRGLESFL